MSAPRPSLARAWFDLARAGNFPSVWSNVLAASVLSSPAAAGTWPEARPWLLATVAGTLAYAGGTTLNDVFDAGFDRRHRPERAIPTGVVSRTTAGVVGTFQLLAGLCLLLVIGAGAAWVVGLAAAILLYDWLHKRWTGSVLLMAACRAFLALSVASLPGHAFTTPLLAWIAALFIYIVVLSLLARREYLPGAPSVRLGKQVAKLLAFIPLLDAVALASIGAFLPALACALSIPLGRAAQRLAAST